MPRAKLRDLPTAQRRRVWLTLIIGSTPSLAGGWLIARGHPAIGIGILIAVFILPEFVLMPIRIRRSRRVAAEARARREAKAPPTQ